MRRGRSLQSEAGEGPPGASGVGEGRAPAGLGSRLEPGGRGGWTGRAWKAGWVGMAGRQGHSALVRRVWGMCPGSPGTCLGSAEARVHGLRPPFSCDP